MRNKMRSELCVDTATGRNEDDQNEYEGNMKSILGETS
jgi:hypothetical protein